MIVFLACKYFFVISNIEMHYLRSSKGINGM
ncbi:hypothetical protein BAN_0900037 (plasmid) [Borrelia anserina BA2]|uniref:Uncharacterized protein n=1 Tax=Borrelia anserina BA2 TaxID=1313293 RepID=W5SVH9_BORAN|nr:hypothetical protein BAN_0900037 [Borrelia anserina BA2]